MFQRTLALDFGRDGNVESYLGIGWSSAETGFRWMVGEVSELWLEHPGPGCDYILELDLKPFAHPPLLPVQRLIIHARGREIGRAAVGVGSVLGFYLPASLLSAPGPVRVVLQHPDAAKPNKLVGGNDDRKLALSVRSGKLWRLPVQPAAMGSKDWSTETDSAAALSQPRPITITPGELVRRFESLGDNAEFGLVQRYYGQEPSALLHIADIGLESLLRGLRTSFSGLGDENSLELRDDAARRACVLRDIGFGITFPKFPYNDQVTKEALLRQQSTRLKLLARKLLDGVRAAEKSLL